MDLRPWRSTPSIGKRNRKRKGKKRRQQVQKKRKRQMDVLQRRQGSKGKHWPKCYNCERRGTMPEIADYLVPNEFKAFGRKKSTTTTTVSISTPTTTSSSGTSTSTTNTCGRPAMAAMAATLVGTRHGRATPTAQQERKSIRPLRLNNWRLRMSWEGVSAR